MTKNLDLSSYLVNLKSLVDQEKVDECQRNLIENADWMKAIKLQVLWFEKYKSKDKIKKLHHATIYQSILPLLTEIIEGNRLRKSDKENLYQKLVIFVIIFAGLGSPIQASIIKETHGVLCSIFKNTEIDNLLSLPTALKEEQLFEFARIATGIRLFNKDCKKGGEGIEDLPLILPEAVKAIKDRILQFKNKLDKRIDRLVNVLCHVYNIGETEEKLIVRFPRDKIEETKSHLIYYRQLELCLKDLLNDLHESSLNIEELIQKFHLVLLQVHDVVRYRVAIATAQVFPLFRRLSGIWIEMQEEVAIISEIGNSFVVLTSAAEVMGPGFVEMAFRPLADSFLPPKPDDIVRYAEEFHEGVKLCSLAAVSPENPLQFKGFCSWTLAQTEGVLLTSNIAVGVLSFENRFYSFISVDKGRKWAKNPNYYVRCAMSVVRNKPELIGLLNIADDLKAESTGEGKEKKKSITQREENKGTNNADVQTELHPVKSLIDKDYSFSEWHLRLRALKLANLSRCMTKSQQTINSSFRRAETGVQITPMSLKETQTKNKLFAHSKIA